MLHSVMLMESMSAFPDWMSKAFVKLPPEGGHVSIMVQLKIFELRMRKMSDRC
jgi:hypothetical protein